MDKDELNQWAAEFIGESEQSIEDAVANSWYTDSFGSAAVVLGKCIAEGKNVKLETTDEKCEVVVGHTRVAGSVDELPSLIIRAARGHDA